VAAFGAGDCRLQGDFGHYYSFNAEGNPALVVELVKAAILVIASSNVTTAVLCGKDTSADLTPSMLFRAPFTIMGQEAQDMFSTFSVTVCSAANVGKANIAIAIIRKLILWGIFRLWGIFWLWGIFRVLSV